MGKKLPKMQKIGPLGPNGTAISGVGEWSNPDQNLPILRSQQCSTILFLLFEALAPTVQEIKSHFWPKSAIFNIREVFVGPYLGSEWNHKNVASYTSYFFTNSVLHMQSFRKIVWLRFRDLDIIFALGYKERSLLLEDRSGPLPPSSKV